MINPSKTTADLNLLFAFRLKKKAKNKASNT